MMDRKARKGRRDSDMLVVSLVSSGKAEIDFVGLA